MINNQFIKHLLLHSDYGLLQTGNRSKSINVKNGMSLVFKSCGKVARRLFLLRVMRLPPLFAFIQTAKSKWEYVIQTALNSLLFFEWKKTTRFYQTDRKASD